MNKYKKEGYEEWIDIAKGIAMLSIMYSHIRGGIAVKAGGGGIEKYQLYRYLEASFIPVFFFFSGFLCHPDLGAHGWKYELGKRLKRLLIPYVGYSLLLYSLFVIWNHSSIVKPGDYLRPLFGMIYCRAGLFYPYYVSGQRYFLLCWNGAFWFITAMAVSTLLYFFYLAKCNNTREKQYISLVVCFLISCFLGNLPILLPWSIDTAFCLVIFMIFGMNISICNYINKVKQKHTVLWLLIMAAYIVLVNNAGDINLSIRQYGSYGSVSVLLYIILGILGSLLYSKIAIILEGTMVGNVLSMIGAHTLSMLCLQFVIFYFCDFFMGYYNIQMIRIDSFAYAIVKIILAVVLSIAFDGIISFAKLKTRWKV